MGKIRVKAFGDEELEQQQKQEEQKRKESKIAAAKGEAVELEPAAASAESFGEPKEETPKVEKKLSEVKSRAKSRDQKNFHSEKYEKLSGEVDKTKTYALKDALELLEKLQRKSFDETVELHINTISTGISGQITLPHGTGKVTRVAIADEKLIAEVEKGIINFDVLVAEPMMMAKLAKVAKVLGPRGLMPNPKNGTITPKPEEVAKKYAGGQMNFKTEAKAPIMHLTVGKVSFGPAKLTDNIDALIAAIKKANIVNATLKSTMSPGHKIKI